MPGEESRPGPRLPRSRREDGRIPTVEDNRDTARMTGRPPLRRVYEVRTAFDGHEANASARGLLPHVVLLDIGLPSMNGYDVASVLRRDACCRDAVIVAISGYGEAAARDPSRAAGFDHHLTKSVDFDRLDEILRGIASPVPG